MGFMESFFGGKEKKSEPQPPILDSYEQVDPERELGAINERIIEIDNIKPEEWSEDLAEEMKVLEEKRRNLEETIKKRVN